MSFFESLVVLLMVAAVLLQVSRRLSLPYPAMLAAAGVLVALLPGTPRIGIEPETALALFIAPVIVDAAFDFPPGAALRLIGPLLTFAVLAVIVTCLLVAVLTHEMLHVSWAAAVALGAIVAPPDAAAASAVLSAVPVPRRIEELLKGESLFNDATALLLFSGALAVQAHGAIHLGTGLRLFGAVPGGVLLGIALAFVMNKVMSFFRDTLGGNMMQFVVTYLVWILAQRLGLSAVLCAIAFAMTLAHMPEQRSYPRMRVQSFAVWSAVVFTLNVLAFLIMGMQARSIVSRMQGTELRHSILFACVIVATVIVARFVIVVSSHGVAEWWLQRMKRGGAWSTQEAAFVGWSGMRGFVTLATAFALPEGMPERDTMVLSAFAVVLGTLVVQGLSLGPLIKLLKLNDSKESERELNHAREKLATVVLHTLDECSCDAQDVLRPLFLLEQKEAREGKCSQALQSVRDGGLKAVGKAREMLETLREEDAVGIAGYLQLQEEIDWRELTLLREEERRIEEV